MSSVQIRSILVPSNEFRLFPLRALILLVSQAFQNHSTLDNEEMNRRKCYNVGSRSLEH